MKTFQYSLEGEYLSISSDGDYATILSEHGVLICGLTKGHICILDAALYPPKKIYNSIFMLYF